jgi:ParB family chromosome partitioning protein
VLEGVLTSELDIPRNVLVELARIEESSLREELLELARAGALTVRAIRNARLAQEERASKVRPASDKPTSLLTQPEGGGTLLNRFSLRSLDRVTGGLRMLRIAGQFVHPIDRERLLALRQEIDALLGSAKEESEM